MTSKKAIAGGSAGAILLLILAIFVLFFVRD